PSSVTVHGGGVDEPLWELTGATSGPSANARYYHADGLGSVVALSAVSSGALTSERRYDAWGKVLPGASGPTEYGFTGRTSPTRRGWCTTGRGTTSRRWGGS
ncbi:MAG: hypothetical protein ACK515_09035, partial [bacterium]|nr:hypothetical protein [Betaproteobacteria bacterium]